MNQKIMANVGERAENYDILKKMTEAGMDIARVNFAHTTNDQLIALKKNLAKVKKQTGKSVAIMQDLGGPRIRVGVLSKDIMMKEGEVYSFSYDSCSSSEAMCIPIDSKDLINDVKVGQPFFLVNGAIKLKIKKIKDGKIVANVEEGGVLSSKKGINLPETIISGGGLTEKDEADAIFGVSQEVDYIGLSFVQDENDIKKLRKIVGTGTKIIAKIERATALERLDAIINESDGVMIARGDLGIETPIEELPILQKEIIKYAHFHKKPAIVATQMMTSMIEKPRPTYAEVTDVANAIIDGADILMLSDETSVGKYPIECITMMKKIIDTTNNYSNKKIIKNKYE